MIYTNPALKQLQQAKAQENIPSRAKLELMLNQGPDLIEMVQGFIDKFSLPYIIEKGSDDDYPVRGFLRDTLSRGELHLQTFITVHPETVRMKEDSKKIALTNYEVLVTGETGTGKEIIAKSMIANREGEIKAVNCAGFPEHLIESELFGHVKGSFTSAERDKVGLLAAAHDGVLFLDEIGELPMSVQAKLLRALQEKTIRKVGSNMDERINCKFVCATHRDLKKMVESNLFRKDLFARISTLEIDIKPLVPDRRCDIIPIAEHLMQSIKGSEGFLEKYGDTLMNGDLDLSLNVRSLYQHIVRYSVFGRVHLS